MVNKMSTILHWKMLYTFNFDSDFQFAFKFDFAHSAEMLPPTTLNPGLRKVQGKS